MQTCPNCGKELSDITEKCECGFNFNGTLDCPYKISLRCCHSGDKCEVSGLDFEDCNVYLKKAGIYE